MKKPYQIIILILIVLIISGMGFWISRYFSGEKGIRLISPNGKEKWQAGKTYQITWQARRIGKVGIMLIEEGGAKESKWVAKDISGSEGKYDWQIFAWENPGQDYKISIFEYPWQEGNKIDYSDDFFTILGPQFASCDSLSIEEGWPYVPSDFPGLRKAFVSQYSFSGDLAGLEGADKKCQDDAEKKGLAGDWKSFLGDDQNPAIDRLKLDGIFVKAEAAADLPEGKTCHLLLAKNFEEFFKRLSSPLIHYPEKISKFFSTNLGGLWLGRVNKDSKRDCITISTTKPSANISEKYSFSSTCQNWTNSEGKVRGYPPAIGEIVEFPQCYTPAGVRIDAVGLAGLSSGIVIKEGGLSSLTYSLGVPCNDSQRLLCVEQ